MRRRDFFTLLGAAAAWPLAARAQGAGDLPRVAILSPEPETAEWLPIFLGRLRELGYVDGRNIRLDTRFAENRFDRLPALAAELVKARPAVIYTYSEPGAFAAAGATASIPIVVNTGADIMEQLAGNLARPVTNVTGFAFDAGGGVAEDQLCLQLLKEAATRWVADRSGGEPRSPRFSRLSKRLASGGPRGGTDPGREPRCRRYRSGARHYTNGTVDGLFLADDVTLAGNSAVRARVIKFAREQHLPSASPSPTYARDGGLLSYGVDLVDIFRRAATYVDRILRGEKPGDLPVQLPTKYDMVINLKTAKALGLTVPITLLGRADEVIE
jgi:putative ABC transport system substrate-binding protein